MAVLRAGRGEHDQPVGTNAFHGSAFYNLQNESFNARAFFSTPAPSLSARSISKAARSAARYLRNKLFFFTTYEGYYEDREIILTGNVPYQHVRDALLAALPFPETQINLDTLPFPTEPIISTAGVVDPNRGRYRGVHTQFRKENHVVAKGGPLGLQRRQSRYDVYASSAVCGDSSHQPINGSNDRFFPSEQNRIASQFVMAKGAWVSEEAGSDGTRHTCPASMSSSTSEIRTPPRPRNIWRSAVPCPSSISTTCSAGRAQKFSSLPTVR